MFQITNNPILWLQAKVDRILWHMELPATINLKWKMKGKYW